MMIVMTEEEALLRGLKGFNHVLEFFQKKYIGTLPNHTIYKVVVDDVRQVITIWLAEDGIGNIELPISQVANDWKQFIDDKTGGIVTKPEISYSIHMEKVVGSALHEFKAHVTGTVLSWSWGSAGSLKKWDKHYDYSTPEEARSALKIMIANHKRQGYTITAEFDHTESSRVDRASGKFVRPKPKPKLVHTPKVKEDIAPLGEMYVPTKPKAFTKKMKC